MPREHGCRQRYGLEPLFLFISLLVGIWEHSTSWSGFLAKPHRRFNETKRPMSTVLTNHKEAAGLDPQLVSLKFSEVPLEVQEDSAVLLHTWQEWGVGASAGLAC